MWSIESSYLYKKISQAIYKEYGLILFAVEVSVGGESNVYLNPSDYVFQDMKHFGYVIAVSLMDVQKIQDFKFYDHIERSTLNLFELW